MRSEALFIFHYSNFTLKPDSLISSCAFYIVHESTWQTGIYFSCIVLTESLDGGIKVKGAIHVGCLIWYPENWILYAAYCSSLPSDCRWSGQQSGLPSSDPSLGTLQIRSTVKDHPWKVLNLDKGHSGSRQDRGLVTLGGLRPSSCSLLACTVPVLSPGTAHLQQCAKPCWDPLPGDF